MSPTATAEKGRISGAEKAAIALLALDEDAAELILKKLDRQDMQRLTGQVAKLREFDSNEVERIKSEFFEKLMQGQGVGALKGRETIRRLLARTLPSEQAKLMLDSLEAGQSGGGIAALNYLSPHNLTMLVRNEHPQTVAIILAHMDPQEGARLLEQLPDEQRSDICFRLARLKNISPQVLEQINEALQAEILQQGSGPSHAVDGVQLLAEIMNNMPRTGKEQMINRIGEQSPELLKQVRDLMFVFEDLIELDDRGMQQVMKEVSNDTLTLSLKTASEALKAKMLKNISQRAAQMIQEEMEIMGPVRISDVEKAQQEILAVAGRLEEEGKIVLGGGGDDLV